jgi:PASTA domain
MWRTDAAAATGSVGTLSWDQTLIAIVVIAVAVLVVGVILVWARSGGNGAGGSVVRSWISLSLVLGLVLFCAFSFAVDDANLRSTLIGGLTASVGAAVTFYFQSKNNQDIMDAASGTEAVPDLSRKTEAEAQAIMAKTSLKLDVGTAQPPAAVTINHQVPDPNTEVRKGSSVSVTFGP